MPAARPVQYFRTRAARAAPQVFLAVLERMKQAAGLDEEGEDGRCFHGEQFSSALPVSGSPAGRVCCHHFQCHLAWAETHRC